METISTNKDKQKSFIIAILLFSFLLTILFFIRFWPPSNITEIAGGGGGGGVEINFGNTDMGMGDNFDNKILDIKDDSKPIKTVSSSDENIITDDNSTENAAVVAKKEPVKKTKILIKNESKPVVAVTKPKVVTNSALNNILKGIKNGDGNSKTEGNQGKNNGNITANGYDLDGSGAGKGAGKGKGNGSGEGDGNGDGRGDGRGNGDGKGIGSGYSLNGRKAVSKPKPDSSCSNDTGNVVVEVTVDKNGNTIAAVVGARGTTVTAKCLKDQAKQAAMTTKWAPSPDGTEQQVGKIVYSFGLN